MGPKFKKINMNKNAAKILKKTTTKANAFIRPGQLAR